MFKLGQVPYDVWNNQSYFYKQGMLIDNIKVYNGMTVSYTHLDVYKRQGLRIMILYSEQILW